MDDQAAFPRVGIGTLIHAIRGNGLDGDLIQWTARCLTDHRVEMVIEGNIVERHRVKAGIPQGTQESPILFPIFNAGLRKRVEEKVTGAEGLSFVDII